MEQKELDKIVENHNHWLKEDVDGWENMKADLREADLCGANLRGAKNLGSVTYNEQTSFFALQCPETGAFVAWKKALVAGQGGSCIVELLVPSEAKRSSATTRKCRVSKAKVLSIKSVDGKEDFEKAIAQYDNSFVYEVGQIVEPKNGFGECRWVECDAGIHCFITRREAELY